MTVEQKEKQPTKKKHARLTPKQWAEAEALWESGEITYEGLAARFGKDKRIFWDHFKANGIVKGSKAAAHKARVAEEVTKAAQEEAALVASRIRETKEFHYNVNDKLGKLVWAEILQARQAGEPVATRFNNLKALELAVSTLKKLREDRFAVLGLDKDEHVDDDSLPSLIVEELTQQQVDDLRSRDLNPRVSDLEMPDLPPLELDDQDDVEEEGE